MSVLSKFVFLLSVFIAFGVSAKTVRYELTVTKGEVNLSGKKIVDWALKVNGGIPAPTLEFTEGDDAEIIVTNKIPDEELSIHWHGILLPPLMDGVPYITTPPIKSDQSFTFRFKIRQHGTFWYHSHTGLQEQRGVYGAFIIHPKKPRYSYDKNLVVVLSDWSDERAGQIMRNLKKDGDYYIYKKNSIRSWLGSMRVGSLGNFLSNEWTRMGGMDLSDVGYDAFLINGKKSSQLTIAHPGEKIRVRIINAGASSYFYVSIGDLPLKVISSDGVDIQPQFAYQLLMGMAEAYDVLLELPEHKNYELRATAQDVTGYASAWIGKGEKVFAPDLPIPDMYASMDHGGHADHQGMDNGSQTMEHGGKAMEHKPKRMMHEKTKVVKTLTVDEIRSIRKTSFSDKRPTHKVKLVLDGDMERYVWHINGKAIHQERSIGIKEGEIVQITYVNKTMMHHPMHLHGHFFRVLNDSKEYSPLQHTVDVPPMGTRTIEFLANEPGQWLLHCHNLYHMKTGMTRVLEYSSFVPSKEIRNIQDQSPMFRDKIYSYTMLEAATNHAQAQLRLSRTWDDVIAKFETREYDNLNHFEGDLFYRRWFGKYTHLFFGGTYYSEYKNDNTRAAVGIGYTLAFLIETTLLLDHRGELRLDLEKRFQWSKNIFTDIEASYRKDESEFEATLMYAQSWHWAVGLMWTEDSFGVGLQVQF